MPVYRHDDRLRFEVAHVLLCASDLVRTSRGGLSDAVQDTEGWAFYWSCRHVLELLEKQIGYHFSLRWGDDPRTDGQMSYADALLEASFLARDHWENVVDGIRIESREIQSLRAEVKQLRVLVEDYNYRGIFA